MQVDLERKTGEVVFDPNVLDEKKLCEVVEDMGFEARLPVDLATCVLSVPGITSDIAKQIQGDLMNSNISFVTFPQSREYAPGIQWT